MYVNGVEVTKQAFLDYRSGCNNLPAEAECVIKCIIKWESAYRMRGIDNKRPLTVRSQNKLKYVLHLHDEGFSKKEIADTMNKLRTRSLKGKQWNRNIIKKLLDRHRNDPRDTSFDPIEYYRQQAGHAELRAKVELQRTIKRIRTLVDTENESE